MHNTLTESSCPLQYKGIVPYEVIFAFAKNQQFKTLSFSIMLQRLNHSCLLAIRDVNRVPEPRDPKKLPDPGFQTTRKLPALPLPHSETTGLPAQQGQSTHCSVLSETVATVSLSAPLPSHTYDAGQTSVTSRNRPCAGQSRLLRLAISPWLRV